MLNMNMPFMQFNALKLQYKNLESQFDNIGGQILNMNNQNISTNIIDLGMNIINNGIQMIFMGIQIPDITRNNYIILNQINDLIAKFQNISMNITNMNYQMPMINMGGLNFNNDFLNNNKEENPKINVAFNNWGKIINNQYNFGTTIDEMLKKYLIRINLPELINNNDAFFFVYNAEYLRFGDNRKIEDVFKVPPGSSSAIIGIKVIGKKELEGGRIV